MSATTDLTKPPAATQAADEMSIYWISHHRLLSFLSFGDSKSNSTTHCIHALHGWKLGQPKFPEHLLSPHRLNVQRHLDNAYLSALIRFTLCEQSNLSITATKLSFITSVLLISRVANLHRMSWLTGVHVFRAGLLCLMSSSSLELAIGEPDISHHIDRSVKLCTQLLGRICTIFAGLVAHTDVCEMLADIRRSRPLPMATSLSGKLHELIAKLPSSLGREMALKTLSALSATCLEHPTKDEMVTIRVTRYMTKLSKANDEDETLYRMVFGTAY
jgi:hypothetical protein